MKNNVKNIVIINSVAINGGDEALLVATLLGLQDTFENVSIKVLSNNPSLCNKYIKYVDFDFDWEYAFLQPDLNENLFLFKLKKIFRCALSKILHISYHSSFSRVFASKREKRIFTALKQSDKIILSAGGYIHDFYDYDKRIETLEFIGKHFNKPYYFLFQSLGPFWKKTSNARLINVFIKADKITLREKCSLNHLNEIGYDNFNVSVSNDLAFYLYDRFGVKPDLNKKIEKIAINFREWYFEEEGSENFSKALRLCKHLIRKGLKLTFISTCQGVESYKDDSIFARRIIKELSGEEKKNCLLLSEKHSLEELIKVLSQQDAYIGMRLHGAILSMISGIPAMNIAYEDKGVGIFEQLDLSDCCFSYKVGVEVWINKVDSFIFNYKEYLGNVEMVTRTASNLVKKDFKFLLS